MIPELAQACRLRARAEKNRTASQEEEKQWRALLLRAVAKGATRAEVQASCGIPHWVLNKELKKARAETTDPKLKLVGPPNHGLTLGEYWCTTKGCGRSEGNGNDPLTSAQALALHQLQAHGRRLGKNAMSAAIVKKLRAADPTIPTSELARKYEVSYHAARSARAGKTWRSVDVAPRK